MQTASVHAPAAPPPAGRPRLALRGGVLLGLATIAGWYLLVTATRPDFVGDEYFHVPAARGIAAGDWGIAQQLPMPPTFHWLAAQALRVTGQIVEGPGRMHPRWGLEHGPDLAVLRALNAGLAALTLLAYAAACRARWGADDGARVLRLAWQPIALPLWGLVYTDVAGLLGIVVALACYARARHGLTCLALLGACLVRQSNIVWAAFFAALAALETWRAPAAGVVPGQAPAGVRWRGLLARLWPYVLLLALAPALLRLGGALGGATAFENRPQLNRAQFYDFALFCGVILAPLWIEALVGRARDWLTRLLRPSAPTAGVGLAALLDLHFKSEHPWNVNLNYVHNWPLEIMTRSGAARYAAAVFSLAAAGGLALLAARSPARPVLLLLLACTLVFLAPHYLVDARYYLIPLVLADFCLPLTPGQSRRWTMWMLLLGAGAAAFVAFRPGGLIGIV